MRSQEPGTVDYEGGGAAAAAAPPASAAENDKKIQRMSFKGVSIAQR